MQKTDCDYDLPTAFHKSVTRFTVYLPWALPYSHSKNISLLNCLSNFLACEYCDSTHSCAIIFSLQLTVVIPLHLWMVLLLHIKIQLRELRYRSCVIKCLFQLRGWQQCVEQIRGGVLTLLVIGAHVSIHLQYMYVYVVTMYIVCTYIHTYSSEVCLCHLLKYFSNWYV